MLEDGDGWLIGAKEGMGPGADGGLVRAQGTWMDTEGALAGLGDAETGTERDPEFKPVSNIYN